MTATEDHLPAQAATLLGGQLEAAIAALPSFLHARIFLPTDRVAADDAIEGLARVRALYAYDLDLTYRARLRALKAARTSRRCFIIGNGPSLAKTDLTRLKGEATFATNGFFLKQAELDWSPTYYVVEDHLVGEDRAAELSALTGSTKLFPASLAYAIRPDANTIYFDHRPRISYPDGFDFSFDADVNTFTGGTVTFTCMQLAVYLGFQEIYLIGVDADYQIPADASLSGNGRVKEIDMRSDDPNHFHPDYFGKGKRWHEPNVEVMLGAYAEARRATEARGVSIANATVGGKLETFPRVDYEMLFRAEPAERLLVIDHTQIGDATATGEVKAAILGNWPADSMLQVYDRGHGRLRIAGEAVDLATDDLAARIADFDPDLVFYRPVPRKDGLHDFAMQLIERTKLPLALWIVDDWPSAFALDDPVKASELDADFRWLLARADARFSISAAMSGAFHERYGQPFIPIANGVDPGDWAPARLRPAGHTTVRYAGGLAENMTLESVGFVANAVEKLAAGGLDISFEIKTHGHWRSPGTSWLEGLQHTSVSTSNLPRADYRTWLAEADILVIAYNFDARSRDYIRYSLANKLPECLASGAAVLSIGPEDVGTIATVMALDVGERVTVADEEAVSDALQVLAGSPELRLKLAQRSQRIAFSLFGVREARQAFEANVGRVAAAHRAGDYPRDLHARVDETAVAEALLEAVPDLDHAVIGADAGGWTIHAFGDGSAVQVAGRSWREIGAELRARGHTIYLSEWHPAVRPGARQDWRRVLPFDLASDLPEQAWGSLFAFREDPGWATVRRAFDRHIERGEARRVAPPERRQPIRPEPTPTAARDVGAAAVPTIAPAKTPAAVRRRTPVAVRAVRLAKRGATHLWRRRRWTAPAAVVLTAWVIAGFVPPLNGAPWLLWGSAALATVALASMYSLYRAHASSRKLSREIKRLRGVQRQQRKKLAEASAKLGRLERTVADGASLNAGLLRKVDQLEEAVAKRRRR